MTGEPRNPALQSESHASYTVVIVSSDVKDIPVKPYWGCTDIAYATWLYAIGQ